VLSAAVLAVAVAVAVLGCWEFVLTFVLTFYRIVLLLVQRPQSSSDTPAYLAFGALLGCRIVFGLRLVLVASFGSHRVDVLSGFQDGVVEDAVDALILNSRRIYVSGAVEAEQAEAASKRASPSQWRICVSEGRWRADFTCNAGLHTFTIFTQLNFFSFTGTRVYGKHFFYSCIQAC
jgi:hypothetical protein